MPLPITSSVDYRLLECNTYLPILNKIIFDELTELLRELLQHSIANSKIEDYYHAVKRKLKRRFTQREEELIFNASRTGYRPFDITVIAVLLRHFYEKNNVETHITSLIRIRNELCHLKNTNITESQFDIYFGECCDIAFALEEYLKKPKFLVQKFQIIYEVNTRSKQDRNGIQIETIKHSLLDLELACEGIHCSEWEERLEFLEENISQIDREINESHRKLVYLKKYVQQVKEKFDAPEEKQWFGTSKDEEQIETYGLKCRQKVANARTKLHLPLCKSEESSREHDKLRCKWQMNKQPPIRSYGLETVNRNAEYGIIKCVVENLLPNVQQEFTEKNNIKAYNGRSSKDKETFHNSAVFSTLKKWDKKSNVLMPNQSNNEDRPVVSIRNVTKYSCGLGTIACVNKETTRNDTLLFKPDPVFETINQFSDEVAGICPKLSKTETNEAAKMEYTRKPVDFPLIVCEKDPEPESRSTFSPPLDHNYFNSNKIVVPVGNGEHRQHRQSYKPHSLKKISEVILLAKQLSDVKPKARKLYETVCVLMRNRNRRRRKKMKDRLNDLGVDWRMGVTELELEDIPQSIGCYCGTAVVLHSEHKEDYHDAEYFLKEVNRILPEVKIELQEEVRLPGKRKLDVRPYFSRQYIFVLLSNYKKSQTFKYIVDMCLLLSLQEEDKHGRVIPVLFRKEDELPDAFLLKEPIEHYDQSSMNRLTLLFKPKLQRSMSCL
ncbi:uncharacterized protein LOC127698732 [Mytilus californianus]|uniref:uncharacterized protein LOC127698732 n=1 Tax=Mytilus californianus TaxID=6549 RepID=UPI002247DC4E|nr:uncharacterized protein LOC127698732 [Mytilus californianus]XP_052058334.1 uncharacterized protein LOC127698732 [Mytilus californianus]